MEYVSIKKTVHMGNSTKPLQEVADEEYRNRLAWPSTFSSHINLDGSHELFVVMTRKLVYLLDGIRANELRIQTSWAALPGLAMGAYLSDLLADEMLTTTQMEGVRSTRQEMDDALRAVSEGKTNKRFSEFAKLYKNLTKADTRTTYPRTLQQLRDIYDRITDGELASGDEPDGELFRAHEVHIIDPIKGSVHDGLMPEPSIAEALTQMLQFAQHDDFPSLVKSVICHYVFEYVHPFYDGNGRTGRFLLSLQLCEDLSVPTVLSVSPVIAEYKGGYDRAFEDAEEPYNCSELTFFVGKILGLVHEAQTRLMSDLEDKTRAMHSAKHRLQDYVNKTNCVDVVKSDILGFLIQAELFGKGYDHLSRAYIAHMAEVGYARAKKVLDGLIDEGLARAKGKRPIYYVLSDKGRAMFIEQ